MESGDVVWQILGQHCAFKFKTTTQNFCRNEYNATGLCNRQSCPLANSRYATVREVEGVVYLYVKTPERAHLPSRMWERIKLSNNYSKALEQIDKELLYWPEFMAHRCKQRLTKITQYLIKMRRLRLSQQPTLIGVNKKVDRREARREAKALAAAHLEKSIEKELIERLKSKAYGDAPLNVNEDVWRSVLENAANKDVDAEELEDEEELEEEWDEDGLDDREFVSDDSELEDDFSDEDGDEASNVEDSDVGEAPAPQHPSGSLRKRKASPTSRPLQSKKSKNARSGARVEVEIEEETEPMSTSILQSW